NGNGEQRPRLLVGGRQIELGAPADAARRLGFGGGAGPALLRQAYPPQGQIADDQQADQQPAGGYQAALELQGRVVIAVQGEQHQGQRHGRSDQPQQPAYAPPAAPTLPIEPAHQQKPRPQDLPGEG